MEPGASSRDVYWTKAIAAVLMLVGALAWGSWSAAPAIALVGFVLLLSARMAQ